MQCRQRDSPGIHVVEHERLELDPNHLDLSESTVFEGRYSDLVSPQETSTTAYHWASHGGDSVVRGPGCPCPPYSCCSQVLTLVPHSPACGLKGKPHSGLSIGKFICLKIEASFSGVICSIIKVRYRLVSSLILFSSNSEARWEGNPSGHPSRSHLTFILQVEPSRTRGSPVVRCVINTMLEEDNFFNSEDSIYFNEKRAVG